MDTNRIPKQALRYRPKGRRYIGRPKKRWRDQLNLRINQQETCLTPQEHDDDDEIKHIFTLHFLLNITYN